MEVVDEVRVVGDVKCYHCGHVSGQIEGTRGKRLVLHAFKPRPGFRGKAPKRGAQIRCERCGGPVFLEDLQPIVPGVEPIPLPTRRASSSRGRGGSSKNKAA